jgi:hypothetical protein
MSDQRATPASAPRIAWLRTVGWVAYIATLVAIAVFVVLSVQGLIPKTQQLYPLPGVIAGLLIIGLWTAIGPALYKSRSTATRVGKYVLAILVTIVVFPLVVTGVSTLSEWIVSLFPGHSQ